MIITAKVPTTNGSKYLQQLSKHWSHKFEVNFTPEHSAVKFGEDSAVTMDAQPETLDVKIEIADPETADTMERVVAEHISRFAFRETLAFDWQRSDASVA